MGGSDKKVGEWIIAKDTCKDYSRVKDKRDLNYQEKKVSDCNILQPLGSNTYCRNPRYGGGDTCREWSEAAFGSYLHRTGKTAESDKEADMRLQEARRSRYKTMPDVRRATTIAGQADVPNL
jgi:hypothetical protein